MPVRGIRKAVNRNRKRPMRMRRKPRPVVMNSKLAKIQKGPFSAFNAVNPFPVNYNTKFVYSCESELTTSTTRNITGGVVGFRLNSPYDPSTTSGITALNTAVYGYDKLLSSTGPYQRYKVKGVKIDLLIYNPSVDGIAVCAKLKTAGSSLGIGSTDIQYLEKTPFCKVSRVNDTGSQKRRVVQYVPMHLLHGWTAEQFRVETGNTTGPYNNIPAADIQLYLAATCTDSATASVARTVSYKLKITYYTQCYERYDLLGQEAPV